MSGKTKNTTQKPKRIGIRDVARLAGVAPMTVSRALSAPEVVAPATRERIARAAALVGYIPNRVASSLSSNRSRLVGAIIPSFQTSIATDFTGDMAKVLRQSGYQLLLGATNFSIDEEESLVIEFLSRCADGIYLTGATHTERTRQLLKSSGVAVVEVASLSADPIDVMVGFSNFDASFEMTKHLAGRGY
jgi:LacI family gluconate utilization system Gnt-I transcriptional repressor